MNRILISLMILCAVNICDGEDIEVENDFESLSKRLLGALQSEKTREILGCWISKKQLITFMKNPPPGIPEYSEKQITDSVTLLEKRDEVIKERIPKTIKLLKEKGLEPGALKYQSSKGKIHKIGDLQLANDIKITLTNTENVAVELSLDDGIKLNGTWYFNYKPHSKISISKDQKTEVLKID